MLSYQHVYHAGGPADVHKHALVCALLRHLRAKEKPFVAIDLYAGEGIYDLTRAEAQKLTEYRRGIEPLWRKSDLPAPLKDYVDAVRAFNPDANITTYPGSPALLRAALRPEDRLILNELHPAAHDALKRWARSDDRIAVHKRDAAEAVGGLLPPPIRRGMLLIDPSYEQRGDYASVAADVQRAHERWPAAIIAVWFPRLADAREAALIVGIGAIAAPTFLSAIELDAPPLADAPNLGLRGSGMIVVNPPWQFDNTASAICRSLVSILGQGPRAGHELRWLVSES